MPYKLRIFRFFLVVLPLLLLLQYLFRFHSLDLRVPFSFDGDALLSLAAIKTMIADGWVFHSTQLGMPFGFNFLDFPGSDGFFFLVLKALTLFSHDHNLVLNIFYIFGFALIYFSTYWAARKFEINSFLAIAMAIIFTIAPYHFLRNAKHLFLATYFIVPLITVVIFDLTSGVSKGLDERNTKITSTYFLILLLAGMCGVYYAFFSILLFIILAIIALDQSKKKIIILKNTAWGCLIIITSVVINLLPNIYYRFSEGPNLMVAQRSFIESEIYGLKLIQLILPIWGHSSPVFSFWNHKYQAQVLITEATSSALGLIASAGFLFLLASLIFRLRPSGDIRLQVLARINLFAFLIGTVGGIGVIFAFFVTPEFRGLNRISIFIMLFSLLGLTIAFQNFLDGSKFRYKNFTFLVASLGFIGFAIFDQIPQGVIGSNQELVKSFYREKAFFQSIEKVLPEKSIVYQYPYVQFPEVAELHKEGYYAYFRPYLQSYNLGWSYGAIKGRIGDSWNKALDRHSSIEQLDALSKSGFSGILINTQACQDGCADMLRFAKATIKGSPIISPDGVYVFYELKPTEHQQITPQFGYLPEKGLYGIESDKAGKQWSWGSNLGGLIVYNFSKSPRKALFDSDITVVNSAGLNVQIGKFNENIAFVPNQEKHVRLTLDLMPGKNIIRFDTGKPPIDIPPDPRKFGFRLSSIRIAALD